MFYTGFSTEIYTFEKWLCTFLKNVNSLFIHRIGMRSFDGQIQTAHQKSELKAISLFLMYFHIIFT